jgi:hypothetical protein
MYHHETESNVHKYEGNSRDDTGEAVPIDRGQIVEKKL